MNKVILIAHQKGGVGKTNTAVNLASGLSVEHYENKTDRILLVDADPQGSLYSWNQRRLDNGLPEFPCFRLEGNITAQLKRERENYDYVIVDAAGRDSREMRSAMLAADLFVMPTKASHADLELLEHMAETVQTARDYNEDLKVAVFVNMAPTTTNKERDAAKKLLAEYPEFELLNTTIADRKAHRDAFAQAVGVHSWHDPKATKEISELLKEIIDVIKR